LNWFGGVEVVVVTAGASAPEDLVDACLRMLDRHFGIQVEERSTLEEHVVFPLPIELRTDDAQAEALSLIH
jgi:4-hydroxy-3-methylbut-2-enyl diphosphate reductase